MNTSVVCPENWGNIAELKILDTCDVSTPGDLTLRLISVIICAIVLVAESTTLFIRRSDVEGKKVLPKVILFWALLENVVMPLRPLIGLLTSIRTVNSVPFAILTHLSASSVAGLAVLVVYFELKLLYNSSMVRGKVYGAKGIPIILIIAGILQFLLFILGPVLVYFNLINNNQSFWTPVIVVDFTIIPYFCVLGSIILHKIRSMKKTTFTGLSKQLMIMIISCTVLGAFTGVVGIFAWRSEYPIEWILIELCWISAIAFSCFIFTITARRRSKGVPPGSKDSSGPSIPSTPSAMSASFTPSVNTYPDVPPAPHPSMATDNHSTTSTI